MIVPRFTFFTENFVMDSYQVTKMFRSAHDCTSTTSARSPNEFSSSSRNHYLGPSESAYVHCACPSPVPLLLAAPIAKRIECSLVFFFELVCFWQGCMPCRGHIALVFQSLLSICPQISLRRDSADEELLHVFPTVVLCFSGDFLHRVL